MSKNVIDGVNNIIDESLGITHIGGSPHYRHRKSCASLIRSPESFDGYKVICRIYDQLEQNFMRPENRFHTLGPSVENWRFEKKLYLDKSNNSKEKTLEKNIVKFGSEDWVNQVPTSSGIISSASDKLRNIDLVRRVEDDVYEFIELKIDSDTPLFAAFEITINGLIYLLSKRHYSEKYLADKEIFLSDKIILKTLAPKSYYSIGDLKWLASELNCGLRNLLNDKFSNKVQMNFTFSAFPENFVWPCDKSKLLHALDNINPVIW